MPPRFTPSQVDDAIRHVIEYGAQDRAKTIRYTEVFVAAGMDPPQDLHLGGDGDVVTAFMKAFHDRCREISLPPLDSLVVHVAGVREGHPGKGYFAVNGHIDPFGQSGNADQVTSAFAFWDAEKRTSRTWGDEYRRGHIASPI